MKRILALFLASLAVLPAEAKKPKAQTLIQSGPWTPGHIPAYYPLGAGSSVPLVIDSGAAGGTGQTVQGVSEMLMIRPSSPTGPNNSNWCDYDANPATSTTGYHYLCITPNNGSSAGAIIYGAVAPAPAWPLNAIINGVSTQIGGGTAGTIVFPATVTGGVSGGIPYFSSTTVLSSSAALAANALVIGGGAGAAPSTTTTGTGVLTAVGNAVNAASGLANVSGSITTNDCLIWGPGVKDSGSSSCGGSIVIGTTPVSGGSSGFVLYNNAGVAGNLPVTGTAGNVVLSNTPTLVSPILGTPTSVTLTNAIGLPLSTGISGLGTGVATALAANTNASGGVPTLNGAPIVGNCLTWSSSGILGNTGCGLIVGTSTITGGVSGRYLYDNAGVVGELTAIPAIVDAQTGVSYTVPVSDNGNVLTLSNVGAVAVTLPQATGSYTSGFNFCVQNLNTGLVTITPTTSTINGASTLTLFKNQGVCVASDGTNWQISGEYTGQGTANQILTTNSSANGYAWTSQPSVTGLISIGSHPTITPAGGSCAGTVIAGGATTGTLTLTGACAATNTLAFTSLPTAPTGYVCFGSDRTAAATLLTQSASTTTGATLIFSGSTSGATDVITFSCTGY